MASPLQGPDTSRLRLTIIGVIVISLFGALFARLWFLQVMDSEELATKVVHNATRTVFEPAPRGRIPNGTPYDLGKRLAVSRPD